MLYPFSALLARMKYITRWSLMHSTRAESLSEHTCDTALLAHLLCLIAKHYTGTPCRPEVVAVAALYHDAPEIITGDMPTPVKYHSPALRDAYKALETESVRSMAALLPAELAAELTPCMDGSVLTAEEHRLLKAADRLSALIKCTEEQRTGGRLVSGALPALLHPESGRADEAVKKYNAGQPTGCPALLCFGSNYGNGTSRTSSGSSPALRCSSNTAAISSSKSSKWVRVQQ